MGGLKPKYWYIIEFVCPDGSGSLLTFETEKAGQAALDTIPDLLCRPYAFENNRSWEGTTDKRKFQVHTYRRRRKTWR